MEPKFGPMQRAVQYAIRPEPGKVEVSADAAARALLRQYARILDAAISDQCEHCGRGGDDEMKVFAEIGPKLLATLNALGLTPAGRSGGKSRGDAVANTQRAVLDELRERRRRKAGGDPGSDGA